MDTTKDITPGINPVRPEQNYGLGKSLYNNAIEKLIESNKVPRDDKSGLSSRLNEESNVYFRQSIPYLQNAIKYFDNLNEKEKGENQLRLCQCLNSLHTAYLRLGLYDELKPIKTLIDEYQ